MPLTELRQAEPAPAGEAPGRAMGEALWWMGSMACLAMASVMLLRPITGSEFRHDDFDWLAAARAWSESGAPWHSPTGLTIAWDVLFLAVYKRAGLDPAPYYWLLIGLHAAASGAVLWAMRQAGQSRLRAFSCAVWFGLLWQHHEAVTWIAVGYRPLAMTFLMLCLGCFARHRRGQNMGLKGAKVWLAASSVFALLALLSKEDALPLLLLLPLADRLLWKAAPQGSAVPSSTPAPLQARGLLVSYVPLGAAYVVYVAFRMALAAPGGGAVAVEPGMYWPGPHMISNLILCVPQMLVPDPGFVTYAALLERLGVGPSLLPTVRALAVGVQAALSLLALLAVCGRGRIARRVTPEARFAVAWCYLTFLPFVPFAYGLARAPRYLYVPSLGLCLLLALATEYLWLKWQSQPQGSRRLRAASGLMLLMLGLAINVPIMRKVMANRLRDSIARRAIAVGTRAAIPDPASASTIYLLGVPGDIEDAAKGIPLLYPSLVRCEVAEPRLGWPPNSYALKFEPENWSRAPRLVHAPR